MAKSTKAVKAVSPAAPAKVVARKRAPLAAARVANKVFTLVASGTKAAGADLTFTSKGTNPKKARVYGYDNLGSGGGVPKQASIVLVAGAAAPAGVTSAQWALLQQYAGKSVTTAYDNGVASRSVRRAYRAGAIRFGA